MITLTRERLMLVLSSATQSETSASLAVPVALGVNLFPRLTQSGYSLTDISRDLSPRGLPSKTMKTECLISG